MDEKRLYMNIPELKEFYEKTFDKKIQPYQLAILELMQEGKMVFDLNNVRRIYKQEMANLLISKKLISMKDGETFVIATTNRHITFKCIENKIKIDY